MPAKRAVIGFALVCFWFCQSAFSQTAQRIGMLDSPQEVVVDLKGFRVHMDGIKPDGRRYFFASSKETGVNLSVTMENARGTARKESCHRVLQSVAQAEQPPKRDVEILDAGDRMTLRYTVLAKFQGEDFTQGFLRVCIPFQGVYLDLNFSKVGLQPGEEKRFQEILDSVILRERPEGAMESWEHWKKGGAAYMAGNYREAIGPFRKALELEKVNRLLPRDLWRVLVDNLGMAYGISGDLKNAKEVFEYGLSQEADYPLFHYNLACTYAEMNDMANTMSYLKRAFELKANLIAGENMPDPREDDSFRRFMKVREFRELAENLMRVP
jgi:tetratricopeptide (TPR) repeat protein